MQHPGHFKFPLDILTDDGRYLGADVVSAAELFRIIREARRPVVVARSDDRAVILRLPADDHILRLWIAANQRPDPDRILPGWFLYARP